MRKGSRKATLLDIPTLIKIDTERGDANLESEAYLISTYMKMPHISFYLSGDKRAYALFEVMHPGTRASAHYNGILRGKEAKRMMEESSTLFFRDNREVQYLFLTFPKGNKKLRMLGSKVRGVSLVGEIEGTDDIMYTLVKSNR